jgi:hypothetical protein
MADGLRFFQDGVFDPDLNLTSAMGEAFERACKSLHDMGQPDIVKEIIAKRIVEVAKTGERDPVQLCERALAALGLKPRD